MGDLAIRVENLGKRYRIGPRERYRTLRDTLTDAMHAPLRRIRSAFRPPSLPASQRSNGDDTIWALKDVSFEIKRGDVVGVIGRNGAGKSTLLKILSRITEPTEGTVEIHGRVGSLLEVGTGFHPELTGRENIYLNAAIMGMKRTEIERKFDEIVAFADVEKFLDTPVKHYSSGMYVRLAFAVAAHLEPEILLVDEVLAVGDIAFQKKCLGKMENVAKEGRTVLFVSHNLVAIRQLCQHAILLHEGRLLRQGPVGKVVQEYVGATAISGSCVVLAPTDHVTGLNGIRVWKVDLIDGVGNLFAVPWKRPIHLALEIEVVRSLQSVVFGLGITTLDGVAVFTVHNTDFGDEPMSLAPGRYQVEVKLDNPLRIGMYNLILGAHEAIARTSIFYIPNVIRLEVINSADVEERYFEHNSGIVNGSSLWMVSDHPPASTFGLAS